MRQRLRWFCALSVLLAGGPTVRAHHPLSAQLRHSNNLIQGQSAHPDAVAYAPAPADSALAKPTVAAGPITLCQFQSAPPLSASAVAGASLVWYGTSAAGGTGSATAPQPPTAEVGTTTYYVAQKRNEVESERAGITVTVVALPAMPALPQEAYTFCQNAPTSALPAVGQNLNWYDGPTGGTGISSLTPTTKTAGTALYYVSQTVNGCESPRNRVAITVLETPPAPTVVQAAYEFCQGTANATISGLITPGLPTSWYIYGDSPSLTNLYPVDNVAYATVSTVQSRTLVYSLFQTTPSGCKSPASPLITVTVKPVPAAPPAQSVGVCANKPVSLAQSALQNLRWYATNTGGTGTTAAPVGGAPEAGPVTYYVSQTVDGCESPRAAVTVRSQTLPTLSLSITGTDTVNAGVAVPLTLTFTGVGPYLYTLSDGSAGMSLSDTTIRVLPPRSTIYRVMDVANACGAGQPGDRAEVVVTVNVPSIQTLALTTTTVCAGSGFAAPFTTSGVFNAGSVFTLQYARVEADSAKASFVDVPGTQAGAGTIAGVLPATLPAGSYWVRVMATNPAIPIPGSISPTRLTVRAQPTATLTGTQTIAGGQPAKLSVAFTGDGPWRFSYRDSTAASAPGTVQTMSTDANPYVFEVKPARTTAYVLTDVSNGCGSTSTGAAAGRIAVVDVTVLLSTDDQSLAEAVTVFPVPTATTLTVRIDGLTTKQPALLELTDPAGRTTLRHETRQSTSVLALDAYPAGTYMLRIRVGNRTAVKRIVKL